MVIMGPRVVYLGSLPHATGALYLTHAPVSA